MKWGEVALGILAVGAVGGVVYGWRNREPVYGDAARAEVIAQKPEIDKCKQQLAAYQKAYDAYCKGHKGNEPTSADALFPVYLKDPDILLCPTARRWMDKKYSMAVGKAKVNGEVKDTTYGFQWLTAGAVRSRRLLGEKAPLVLCRSHSEAIYMVAYKRRIPLGIYSGEKRQGLIPEVREAEDLVVRRNGSVEGIDPADE